MFTFEGHNGTVQSAHAGAGSAEYAATVLIAEDDRRVRDSLDRYLRLEGYDVVAVPDGAAALTAHDARRPDLMVSGGGVAGRRLDRRRFIKGGLGAAGLGVAAPLLAACSGRETPEARVPQDERIVVVGAGIAGLAAADELRVRGFDNVVILEARDRVGGRIWTSSIGDGVPVEMGATWIHGIRGNPVHEIAESNGIATISSDYDNSVVYDRHGREIGPVDRDLWHEYMRLAYEMPDASLREVFERFAALKGLDDDERRLWLHSLSSMFEHEFAADLSELSIMSYDGPSTLRGGDVVFPGGYSQIVEVLAAGRDIRLDSAVAEVDHSGPGVVVTTDAGATFEADRVIVTVPLGILKAGAVSFTPSLPPAKQDAVDALEMGILNRTCLLFDDAFWPRDVEWIGYAGEHKGQWSETLNLYPYLGQPALAMFNPGSYGAEVESLSDRELVARAVQTLEAIFSDVPEPIDSVSTRWGSDPWTRGSYSYVPVGVPFETYREMARPVGERLFFAGEATHTRFPSTVHGALLSGRRAARQIYGLLR